MERLKLSNRITIVQHTANSLVFLGLVGTVIGFTIATALCGMANSLEMLILFRILQGVFGAPLQPLGQGMLLARFPKHLHAMV